MEHDCKVSQKKDYDDYIDLVKKVHNRRIQVREAKDGGSEQDLREA